MDYTGRPFLEIIQWNSEKQPAIWGIGVVTIGFIIYYFLIHSEKFLSMFGKDPKNENDLANRIIAKRITGALCMGIPSVAMAFFIPGISPSDLGISFGLSALALQYIGFIGGIVLIINIFRAGSKGNLVNYPQIRSKSWDLKLFAKSSLSWILYLLGYELCFRGAFLFGCVMVLGVWPAIVINASIYAFAHLFKGPGETFGAIPFGLIISIISIQTGNFMVAFLVHCVMALSNQTIAMIHHPEMKWKKG